MPGKGQPGKDTANAARGQNKRSSVLGRAKTPAFVLYVAIILYFCTAMAAICFDVQVAGGNKNKGKNYSAKDRHDKKEIR